MNWLRLRTYLNFKRTLCTSINSHEVKAPVVKKKLLVPSKPISSKIDLNKLPPQTKIDADTIAHLERLSLVDCANKEGIKTLEDAIAFADQILQVDTKGIEPLFTVLEDKPLEVREDQVTEGNCREIVLSNASVREEEYFVAPPGNIPLEPPLCEKRGFLRKLNKGTLQIGPVGALLEENLKNEWFYNMVINRDNSVFFSKGSFIDTFEYAKELCQNKLPFGVAEIIENNSDDKLWKEFDFHKCSVDDKKILLKTTMYVTPSNSTQFFHQWQRQRKMWWRKFSAAPGRYILSDIQTDNNNDQSVEIKAEYPWGAQLIESICVSNSKNADLTTEQLKVKDGRKQVQACSISSTISLPGMFLNAICDSYDESEFQGSSRYLFKFHRKLAPYKISFSAEAQSNTVSDDLSDLALYLCRKLRTNHISSLLLPSFLHNNLNEQWSHYDQLGIPYTIVLNESTLKNGIVLLRSRDTTLQEQVHISTLPDYVQSLFKNY